MRLPTFSKSATTLLVLSLALWLSAPYSLALQSDKDQPIEIESERALRDEESGITVYEGSVVVTQGTMRIDADRVTIYSFGENANRIICEGAPAQFQQQLNPDEGLVMGEASLINYDRVNENVELKTEAKVTKADGTLLEGNKIKYNINSKRMNAQSKPGEKVHVVLPPKPKEGDNGDS